MSAAPAITVRELKAKLAANDDVQIIDVREPDEYALSHIEGSRLIPLSSLPQHVDDLPKNKLLVLQCRSGARSAYATEFLIQNGYTNAVNLTGGILAWAETEQH